MDSIELKKTVPRENHGLPTFQRPGIRRCFGMHALNLPHKMEHVKFTSPENQRLEPEHTPFKKKNNIYKPLVFWAQNVGYRRCISSSLARKVPWLFHHADQAVSFWRLIRTRDFPPHVPSQLTRCPHRWFSLASPVRRTESRPKPPFTRVLWLA